MCDSVTDLCRPGPGRRIVVKFCDYPNTGRTDELGNNPMTQISIQVVLSKKYSDYISIGAVSSIH